jgi:predicted transcriptional regulator
MHLKKLEDAGLVTSRLELSEDGKAMRFYEVADFDIPLSPGFISLTYKE